MCLEKTSEYYIINQLCEQIGKKYVMDGTSRYWRTSSGQNSLVSEVDHA